MAWRFHVLRSASTKGQVGRCLGKYCFLLPALQQPSTIKQVAHGEKSFNQTLMQPQREKESTLYDYGIYFFKCLIIPKAMLSLSLTAHAAVRHYGVK